MKQPTFTRILPGGAVAFIVLLVMQVLPGKAVNYIANIISYNKIDPYDIFAGISIHHVVQMLVALAIIVILSKMLKLDFYFKLGDAIKSIKCLGIFTAVFVILAVFINFDQSPIHTFPLDTRNIQGTLGFQLLISGTSEEIVFRALPITILVHALGKSVSFKANITLEVILASILFSVANTHWSLMPFSF